MLSEIFEPIHMEENVVYLIGEERGKSEMIYGMFAQKIDMGLIATIANMPLPAIQEMHEKWQKDLKPL